MNNRSIKYRYLSNSIIRIIIFPFIIAWFNKDTLYAQLTYIVFEYSLLWHSHFVFLFFPLEKRKTLRSSCIRKDLEAGVSVRLRTCLHFSGHEIRVTFQVRYDIANPNRKDATLLARTVGDRRPGGRRRPRSSRPRVRRVGPSMPDIAPRPWDDRGFATARPEFFALFSSGGNSRSGKLVVHYTQLDARVAPRYVRQTALLLAFPYHITSHRRLFLLVLLHVATTPRTTPRARYPLSAFFSPFWYLEGTTWEIDSVLGFSFHPLHLNPEHFTPYGVTSCKFSVYNRYCFKTTVCGWFVPFESHRQPTAAITATVIAFNSIANWHAIPVHWLWNWRMRHHQRNNCHGAIVWFTKTKSITI